MKVRTMAALAVGYGLGARLGPERIEALLQSVLDGETFERKSAARVPHRESEVEWPDASFRI